MSPSPGCRHASFRRAGERHRGQPETDSRSAPDPIHGAFGWAVPIDGRLPPIAFRGGVGPDTFFPLLDAPETALAAVYDHLGLPAIAHDFENAAFDAEEFDRRLGTPGLHEVAPRVTKVERRTILAPAPFARFAADAFRHDPAKNVHGVRAV